MNALATNIHPLRAAFERTAANDDTSHGGDEGSRPAPLVMAVAFCLAATGKFGPEALEDTLRKLLGIWEVDAASLADLESSLPIMREVVDSIVLEHGDTETVTFTRPRS